jgi:DNA-binding beta-propeller fold protein YncE
MVHNTLQNIVDCKGKLQLKLIRVWGGYEEEDENKFFYTPGSVAVDDNQLVYICDWHNHCVKVFNNNGNYVRTIGRKGQGPQDLYGPNYITFSPGGDLLVYELGNRRLQWFSPDGKNKHILKNINAINWIGFVSVNEIAVYSHLKTFNDRKLISIMDNKGKILREIGKYHDKSKNFILSERLFFTVDEDNNLYAANMGTPVIRKYSPDGKLIRVITFDTPFDIPVEITLNASGDEIERKEEIGSEDDVKITRSSKGLSIQYKENKEKRRYDICMGIQVDSQNKIFIVTRRRDLTEKEAFGTAISGTIAMLNRSRINYDIVENIDCNHILVFDSKGKIIAESPMTTICDNIYIFKNKIFIIDALLNQRVLEYEMVFL